MNINDLITAGLTVPEQIKAVKDVNVGQYNENTENWINQYEGEHEILKKSDKVTKSGLQELQKTVINYQKLELNIPRKLYERNLDEKMKDRSFLEDITPLLSTDVEYDPSNAYEWFKKVVLPKM